MNKKTGIIALILIVAALGAIITLIIFKNKESISYEVITNMRFKTMLNDGGSNTSVYYQMDLKDNKITKIQEDYKANLQGNARTDKKTLYEKEISSSLSKKIANTLNNIISKEDIKDGNYNFYVIRFKDQSKEIYNKNSIKDIESLLNKIDNE